MAVISYCGLAAVVALTDENLLIRSYSGQQARKVEDKTSLLPNHVHAF